MRHSRFVRIWVLGEILLLITVWGMGAPRAAADDRDPITGAALPGCCWMHGTGDSVEITDIFTGRILRKPLVRTETQAGWIDPRTGARIGTQRVAESECR